MTWGIYIIRNKINGKMYVGMSDNVDRRLDRHKTALENGKHRNKHLQNSVDKYGIENFDFFVIVEHYENRQKLGDLETYFIAKWQLDNPQYGYNKTKGGDGGPLNDELWQTVKQKISYANIKKYARVTIGPIQYNGKQRYVLRYWDKNIISSLDKNYLEQLAKDINDGKITIEDFKTMKEADKQLAKVVKAGHCQGKQYWQISHQGEYFFKSPNKKQVQKYVDRINQNPSALNEIKAELKKRQDWIYQSGYKIAKAGKSNGKQRYKIVCDGKYITSSFNRAKLEEKLLILQKED